MLTFFLDSQDKDNLLSLDTLDNKSEKEEIGACSRTHPIDIVSSWMRKQM